MNLKHLTLILCILASPLFVGCGPTEEDRQKADDEAETAREDLIREIEEQEEKRHSLSNLANELTEEGEELNTSVREFIKDMERKTAAEVDRMSDSIENQREKLNKQKGEIREISDELRAAGEKRHKELLESLEELREETEELLNSLR